MNTRNAWRRKPPSIGSSRIRTRVRQRRMTNSVPWSSNNRPTRRTMDNDEDITITHVEPSPNIRTREDNSISNDVLITSVCLNQPTVTLTTEAEGTDQIDMDVNVGTKCPYTKRTMVNPVRNRICGHNYERLEIRHYIENGKNPRCPISGCKNQMRLQLHDLEENKELQAFINNVSRKRPISHSEIAVNVDSDHGKPADVAAKMSRGTKHGISNEGSTHVRTYSGFNIPLSILPRTRRQEVQNNRITTMDNWNPSGYRCHYIVNVNTHTCWRQCYLSFMSRHYNSTAGTIRDEMNSAIETDGEDEEDDDADLNNVSETGNDDDNASGGEESAETILDYGSEMDDNEPVEHNYFYYDFTDDESDSSERIYCECDDCQENSDEEDKCTEGDKESESTKGRDENDITETGDDVGYTENRHEANRLLVREFDLGDRIIIQTRKNNSDTWDTTNVVRYSFSPKIIRRSSKSSNV